jgi:hypothetical protein
MTLTFNGSNNTISGIASGGLNADAVGIDDLNATGTASASTYLRGDNAWAAISAGITEADAWRVNAHTTSNGGGLILTANWERVDTDGFGKLGTGMTESSGVFTFPSTGIWEIGFFGYCHDTTSSHTTGAHISPTVDNGSNYTTATSSYFSVPNVSTYSYGSFFNTTLFDVTDTSTHKTRFYVYSSGDVTWEGASDASALCAVFKRLGDT